MKEVRVNRRAAERIASGHPWVFRSDVLRADGAAAGAVVQVLDGRNNRLGCAHYSSSSLIAVRMLPFEIKRSDVGFFRRMIRRAQGYRDRVVRDSDAYRVVHAEADLLPGLIVDRYGEHVVIQTLSQGMDVAKAAIVEALGDLFEPQSIVERNEAAVRKREELEQVSGVLAGQTPEQVEVTVNGLRFAADLLGGQKTGLFLDQRENWRAAAEIARGRALDCFAHSGGFALHLAGTCDAVEAVDSSAAAVAEIEAGSRRNGIENITARKADAFELLKQYSLQKREHDVVVLDPPAFAKSRKNREAALSAYKEINSRALRILSKDGVLVSCSCSHHISEADLLGVIAEASLDAGRRLRVVERRTQARDHPIHLTIPETHYLKCLVLQSI